VVCSIFYLCTITIQALASSGAGAFNEWLLKRDIKMGINQKNIYLYFFSLCFNLSLILLNRPQILSSTELFFNGTPLPPRGMHTCHTKRTTRTRTRRTQLT
jgi:hypothetical protein